jgi:hypothetical protein
MLWSKLSRQVIHPKSPGFETRAFFLQPKAYPNREMNGISDATLQIPNFAKLELMLQLPFDSLTGNDIWTK